MEIEAERVGGLEVARLRVELLDGDVRAVAVAGDARPTRILRRSIDARVLDDDDRGIRAGSSVRDGDGRELESSSVEAHVGGSDVDGATGDERGQWDE